METYDPDVSCIANRILPMEWIEQFDLLEPNNMICGHHRTYFYSFVVNVHIFDVGAIEFILPRY